MATLNSSKRRLVTSVEFSKALYSSTHTFLHGCFSLFNVVRTIQIILTGALLDEISNNHSIVVFSHTTLSMKVNPWTEVTL